MKEMKHWISILTVSILLILFSRNCVSAPQIISPLPSGIIQKVNDSGFLRFILRSSNSSGCKVKVINQNGSDIAGLDWHYFTLPNNTVDTSFFVPLLHSFNLKWETTNGKIDSGVITNLSVGYIFGIAGQSNAQGWSYPNYIYPQGKIRMLLNDSAWQNGQDPTGGKWASPWIEFANKLQTLLNDSLPIGLVNVGVGGTGLITKAEHGWWQRNTNDHSDSSTVYGKAISRFFAAGGRFETVFWIQGESDATGTTSTEYRFAFKNLIENFEEDLKQPLAVFHLQIDGQNGNTEPYNWGAIREAQRSLPHSTLIGTSAGAPIGFDAIHYAQNTLTMVGDIFAGAVAKILLGIPNDLYPPLLPSDTVYLSPCAFGDPFTGYKIILQCTRGGIPADLQTADAFYGFQIRKNGIFIDTSEIFATLDGKDRSKINIFTRTKSLTPNDNLLLSYAITADISHVNVTDTSTATILHHYLVSFLDIPVSGSALSSDPPTVLPNFPNPFDAVTTISFFLPLSKNVSYAIYDISAKQVYQKAIGMLSVGNHIIQIQKGSLAAGTYEVAVSFGSARRILKIIIL